MKPLIVRSLILTVGVLLLALTPSGEPLAQLSISPPLGCVEDSGGCSTGGCEACDGTTCLWTDGLYTRRLAVSVEDGLYCTDDYCPQSDCDNPELLGGTGRVTMTEVGQNPDEWDNEVIVCEFIALCSNPGIGCGQCSQVTLDETTSSKTLTPLQCEVSWAGEYQYHIWAVVLDETECPLGCDENDDNACNVSGDCNACNQGAYAHAASCCGTVPSS
jgi:hypothetical protein